MGNHPGFRLRNNTSADVCFQDEVIPAGQVSASKFSVTQLAKGWRELSALGIFVTGTQPPYADATAEIISLFHDVGLLKEGQVVYIPKNTGRNRRAIPQRDMTRFEVITNRLIAVVGTAVCDADLDQVTLVAILGPANMPRLNDSYGILSWPFPEDMDVDAFSGVVRLCASVMSGKKQRVLLVGDLDAIEVTAACVVREFFGCAPAVALGVVRSNRREALTKSELVETVFRYRPS